MSASRKQRPADRFVVPAALIPLTEMPRWNFWKWTPPRKPGDKPGKLAWVVGENRKARSNALEDWTTFEEAAAIEDVAGLGFCLLDSGLAAFDIDNCRDADSGAVLPWAKALVERCGSYTEVTPSKTGLRIIGLTALGVEKGRKQTVEGKLSVESYRGGARWITIAFDPLPGHSETLTNIDTAVAEVIAELDARKGSKKKSDKTDNEVERDDGADEADDLIRNGPGKRFEGDRSVAMWRAINILLRRGASPETISRLLLDKANKISEHVYDQSGSARAYVDRQIAKAREELTIIPDEKKGYPAATPENICVALLKMGVVMRYDTFANRKLIDGLRGFGPALTDHAIIELKAALRERFRVYPTTDALREVLTRAAMINRFHPVCDYLASLSWDGKERIDRWMTVYGGAHDTEYTRAVGRLMLIAAVRRVRQPGCKFDEIPVIEQPVQGTLKSTMLNTLAVREEWFSDDLPLNVDAKRFIEATSGKWIIEAAELSGLRKSDIEHLKAVLSRRVDRARMSYDRENTEAARCCIIVGTTNSTEYLRDATGNRRFWPVHCEKWDIDALKRDRDQLWAEAAVAEAAGASIRLAPHLWPVASKEQETRYTEDPYVDTLRTHLDSMTGKIAMSSLWLILGVDPGRQTQELSKRVGDAMRALGWSRQNSNGTIKAKGKNVSGWVKGASPHRLIVASKAQYSQEVNVYHDGEEPAM